MGEKSSLFTRASELRMPAQTGSILFGVTGVVQLTTSPEDLRQKIIAYLNNPGLAREGRRRIVEQQLG